MAAEGGHPREAVAPLAPWPPTAAKPTVTFGRNYAQPAATPQRLFRCYFATYLENFPVSY